jgi:hypothetical protein
MPTAYNFLKGAVAPPAAAPLPPPAHGRAVTAHAMPPSEEEDALRAIDKVVFEVCVDVQRGSAVPQKVGLSFVFRHFEGMASARVRNTDGE